MAIIPLGNKDKAQSKSDDGDDFKPLVKVYGKENSSIYNEVHRVISGRISQSGDWCILETDEYALLLRAKDSAVIALFTDILPHVDRKLAFELVVQPVKKNKNGGILAVDDAAQCWYSYDQETKSFETSDKQPGNKEKKQEGLTLEMFLGTKDGTTSEGATQSKESDNTKTTRKRTKEVQE